MKRLPETERAWLTPVDTGQDEVTITVRGPVGAAESHTLERAVLEGVLRGRRTVIIDLRGVSDVRPGLLGAILRMRRGLSGVNGRFALVVDGGPVQELVRVSVLRALVLVAATPDEARALSGEEQVPVRA